MGKQILKKGAPMKGRYSIRKNKDNGLYEVYFSGFTPMYCGTFDTKEEAREFIKRQRKIR